METQEAIQVYDQVLMLIVDTARKLIITEGPIPSVFL